MATPDPRRGDEPDLPGGNVTPAQPDDEQPVGSDPPPDPDEGERGTSPRDD